MTDLPPNFDEFVEEIAAGLEALYGVAAGEQYRAVAASVIGGTIRGGIVDAIAVSDGAGAAGFLLGVQHGMGGQVSFVHVLRRHEGSGIEARMVEEAVRTFRAGGADWILSECVAFCALDLHATYGRLGFRHVPRALMEASLVEGPLAESAAVESEPVREEQFGQVAEAIVDAYEGRADRELHAEVRDAEGIMEFLRHVFAGGHGEYRPEFCRAYWREGCCLGALIGCRVAPEHGFVLQVAVRRGHQRQGVATRLLLDAAAAFRACGLTRVALGVTLDNPARRLYERLGFTEIHPVDSYVWRRSTAV